MNRAYVYITRKGCRYIGLIVLDGKPDSNTEKILYCTTSFILKRLVKNLNKKIDEFSKNGSEEAHNE